jgi:hypothetical protein
MRRILVGLKVVRPRCAPGRSTLTPTAVHRMGIGPERGKPRETTSGSQPLLGVPNTDKDQSRQRRGPHSRAGPAALGGAAGPVHRRETAAARTAATRSGLGCGAPITGELAGITEEAMREASGVIRNAKRASRGATGHRKGRLHRAINKLETIIERAERLVAQTRSRLAGMMPESASRVVSLHDVDARPIRKGRLGKPVEFGYKAHRRLRRQGHPRPQRRGRESL